MHQKGRPAAAGGTCAHGAHHHKVFIQPFPTLFANLNPSFERNSNNNSFFQGAFDEIND
jgi:hypothetical protein